MVLVWPVSLATRMYAALTLGALGMRLLELRHEVTHLLYDLNVLWVIHGHADRVGVDTKRVRANVEPAAFVLRLVEERLDKLSILPPPMH